MTSKGRALPSGLKSWAGGTDAPPQAPEPPSPQPKPAESAPENRPPKMPTSALDTQGEDDNRDLVNEPVMPKEAPPGFILGQEWLWMNRIPWAWVRSTRKKMRDQYDRHRAADKEQAEDSLWRELARAETERWVREQKLANNKEPSGALRKAMAQILYNEMAGLGGRVQALIDSGLFTDIILQGIRNTILIPRGGGSPQIGPRACDTLADLRKMVASLASEQGREFNFGEPTFDGKTLTGERVHAIGWLADEMRVTIRCHDMGLATLSELLKMSTVDPALARFLRAAVRSKRNMIISGSTGSGKTTLLRTLINEVPPSENIFTVEDSPELGTFSAFGNLHPAGTALITRKPNLSGIGEVSADQLVRESLRMSPDRVIIGEARGAEAFSLLLAMSQGNNGSMTTIHSNNAYESLERLGLYVSMHDKAPPSQERKFLIAKAVDLVVHVQRRGTKRAVSEIIEVADYREGGQTISHSHVFENIDGRATATDNCQPSNELLQETGKFGFSRQEFNAIKGHQWGRGAPTT